MKQLKSTKIQKELLRKSLDESVNMILDIDESFTKKISSKRNTDLISKPAFVADGVYILHETLGAKTVEGWNPKFNNGVIGILVVEDEHKIVIALEDSPNDLFWSKREKLVNQPIENREDAEFDFNGEEYCRNLNSPDFPVAYYCLNYNKGGRDWYLPSSGELWLIYRHLEEVQNALSIVGGKKFVTAWEGVDNVPWYWSSTEVCAVNAWSLDLTDGFLRYWHGKVKLSLKVRPISKFQPSELKESFTKKIKSTRKNTLKESFTKKIYSKKNTDLISKPSFVPENGVYILHETLGVKTVEGWNPKFNNGVVGILLIEDDHKIVVSLEDAPKKLHWSEEHKLVNHPIQDREDAKSDFNGEEYCRNLNSPDFPAAYYCLNYNKGGRDWYLPSSGEWMLIYRHIEEIQTALSIVEGQKFDTEWDNDEPWYWSSTEDIIASYAWHLNIYSGCLGRHNKVVDILKVRPVSAFSV